MGFVFEDLELNARRENNWKIVETNWIEVENTQTFSAKNERKNERKKSIYTTFIKIIIYCSSRLRAENGIH